MAEEWQDLIERLRRTHQSHPGSVRSRPEAQRPSRGSGFRGSDALKRVSIAKAAGETMGVPSPFFRSADAVNGTMLKIGGSWVENYASYDYLSLNGDRRISEAVSDAVATWGVSATASRLVGGERAYHGRFERKLTAALGTEDAIAMVSGHATNLAILRATVGPGDLVVVDSLAHNSIYEGIRSSGADHVTFPHNDLDWVASYLGTRRASYSRVLIAIEGLYSMDGDTPQLAAFVELKLAFDALLLVDEAHSFGVLGSRGLGIWEERDVSIEDIDIVMGTLSKTLCSCGGFVAGSRDLIELLRYSAPGFVYSVGLSAPNAAAAESALDILLEEPARVRRLRGLGAHFHASAADAGLNLGTSEGLAVAPVIVGDSFAAIRASNRLLEEGFNVLPIIAPAVPDKAARLRFFLNANHSVERIDDVIRATAAVLAE